jgi:RND family efflux transporter MFP subunit
VDYKLAVTLAEAQVKDSESRLKVVQEEAAAAKEEWSLHRRDGGAGTGKEPPPLVAKEPQLAAAEAKLAADRANLKKALLNLSRTEIRAPFEGRVSQESVDVGQYVAPGQILASLYSTEAAEIMVPLEAESLFWLDVPGFTSDKAKRSPAVVRASVAGRELTWAGEVVRAEGKLDERTRMINVVVRVERPYAGKPPLAVGLFVTLEIAGHTLPNAALLPRAALRQENRVWVVEEQNLLRFRSVKVARIDQVGVLIESGLRQGELVVTSPLKSVTDGMTLGNVMVEEDRS